MKKTSSEERICFPCPHMIFDPAGYHGCTILTELYNFKFPKRKEVGHTLCAWFFDLSNPSITVTVTPGKIHWEQPKIEWREPERLKVTEADVPKLCPLKYTFKEIDAKIQPLMQKVNWEKRR